MKNNIEFVVCCESRLRFAWEIAVQLNNAREMGISDKFRILLFNYKLWEPHPNFKILERLFPEVKFFYYTDIHDVFLDIQYYEYTPLIRPYMLRRHFKEFPELEKANIFYLDSDVLFLNTDFITPLLQDEYCHLSNTDGYMNGDYFLSKYQLDSGIPKFVDPLKWDGFKRVDIFKELSQITNIPEEIISSSISGGAQYILKNINSGFWGDVYHQMCGIRRYLMHLNQKYMQGKTPKEREDNGYQSWCADMFALLWTLKKTNKINIAPEMDFAWATDRIKTPHKNLLHNAGVTDDAVIRSDDRKENGERIYYEGPAFLKSNYINSTPFEDIEKLKEIVSHPISSQFYTSIYSAEILKTKNNLNL